MQPLLLQNDYSLRQNNQDEIRDIADALGVQSLRSRCQDIQVWWQPASFPSHCVLTSWEWGVALPGHFYNGSNAIHESSTFILNNLPKLSSFPHTTLSGVRLQHMNLGEHQHSVHSTILDGHPLFCFFWAWVKNWAKVLHLEEMWVHMQKSDRNIPPLSAACGLISALTMRVPSYELQHTSALLNSSYSGTFQSEAKNCLPPKKGS